MGADGVPELLMLNRVDLAEPEHTTMLGRLHPGAVVISARTGQGLDDLRNVLRCTSLSFLIRAGGQAMGPSSAMPVSQSAGSATIKIRGRIASFLAYKPTTGARSTSW